MQLTQFDVRTIHSVGDCRHYCMSSHITLSPSFLLQSDLPLDESEEDEEDEDEDDWVNKGAGERASSKNRPLILRSQERRPTSSNPDRRGAAGSLSPLSFSIAPARPAGWAALAVVSIAVVMEAHRQRSRMASCPESWLHCMKSALLSPDEDSGSPSCTCTVKNSQIPYSQTHYSIVQLRSILRSKTLFIDLSVARMRERFEKYRERIGNTNNTPPFFRSSSMTGEVSSDRVEQSSTQR
jgi:hypothetical protein